MLVTKLISRRMFAQQAAMTLAACFMPSAALARKKSQRTVPLFDGRTLEGWLQIENKPSDQASPAWIVKDGAMASAGAGRGVIYTVHDYSYFRLMFTMRHVSGSPDHPACVLIFCSRPQEGEKPLDALGGIQFQVPNGGHWDYRPGMNNDGGMEFTTVTKAQFDPHAWSRVEILADAPKGTARMAVEQPPGTKAVEVLNFNNGTAGKVGHIAWQIHNAGLFDEYFDEYKDVTIEVDPAENDLLSVR